MSNQRAARTLALWVLVLFGIFVYVGYRLKLHKKILSQPVSVEQNLADKGTPPKRNKGPEVVSMEHYKQPPKSGEIAPLASLKPADSEGETAGGDDEETTKLPGENDGVVPLYSAQDDEKKNLLTPATSEDSDPPRQPLGGDVDHEASTQAQETEYSELPAPSTRETSPAVSPEPEAPTTIAIDQGTRTHVVESGDTLAEIAQRYYGSTRAAEFIYAANRDKLSSMNQLRIGDVLRLPARTEPKNAPALTRSRTFSEDTDLPPEDQQAAPAPTSDALIHSGGRLHTLKRGETIRSLALQYFGSDKITALRAIADANAALIDRGGFRVGTQIRIPKVTAIANHRENNLPAEMKRDLGLDAENSRAADRPRTYTVRARDTLSAIALRYYHSSRVWKKIYAANRDKIPDANHLATGVTIILPPLPSDN